MTGVPSPFHDYDEENEMMLVFTLSVEQQVSASEQHSHVITVNQQVVLTETGNLPS